jgi:DNA (cytosine-5)-methyltransferase 1
MFTFYEFFAGGGMAREGLGAHWTCLFANDFDPKKADSYVENWGDRELLVEDVAALSEFDLRGFADLVWASFPCQDLSLAGNGAGLAGEQSGAFWPFWKLIKRLKADGRPPKIIALENVCGLLTSHGGNDFKLLCQTVSNEGYHFGAVIIDAVHFLPQSRPRLFVIAVRDDLVVQTASNPTEVWHGDRIKAVFEGLSEPLKMRWVWYQLPTPPKRNTCLADLLEPDGRIDNWHSADETQRLIGMMSNANKAKLEMVRSSGGRHVGALYKRTRWEDGRRMQRAEVRFDGVAGCLRTPGGGSSRQTIMVVENGVIRSRLVATRETARLMGLRDSYVLPERYNDGYHLTGDGVAVPAVKFLSENIFEPLLLRVAGKAMRAA